MYQVYINYLNYNRYLKLQYLNSYKYSKLLNVDIFIKFKKNIFNNKLLIICIFFLFKNILLKNGFLIILNKKNKKILGYKFKLKKNLMFNFLNFLINIFLNKSEIQNLIKITSFDSKNNFNITFSNEYNYYFEKYIQNPFFKDTLNMFTVTCIFHFSKTFNIYNNIFYLNLFRFYFNNK